ncbi:MAG: MOSC domain-containing protein [Opitutales bacterium]|nr:MOSC domain-containing protein [Opitutales bacterium]NRA26143.1 MOSC domain-containing protein [Opitutales bacterium]
MQQISILQLYISPNHIFYGHHGKEPGKHVASPAKTIVCHAGHGIEGDRFYDFKENYKGQITFLEQEQVDKLAAKLELEDIDPTRLRRNVITQGIDLNSLIGKEFTIGSMRFAGTEECSPCYWMDHAVSDGAERCLRGHGGLRARILNDGKLSPGTYPLVVA